MILDAQDLHYVDKKLLQEDIKRFGEAKAKTIELLGRHAHADFLKEELPEVPIYWFRCIYPALIRMVQVCPRIRFYAIKSVNYGIKIHHTSDTETLAALDKIKLDLAGKIDEMIINRLREFHKKR